MKTVGGEYENNWDDSIQVWFNKVSWKAAGSYQGKTYDTVCL